jgi:hypothetical protein
MKLRKFMVASAAFIMILGLLVVVPVNAEVTFDSWVGQWQKGAVKEKGVIADDSGTEQEVEKLPTYGFVQSWDQGTMTFTSLLFQNIDGTWTGPVPYVVQVLNDNPLNYVSYALLPPGGPFPEIEILALIINATGKEDKNGALTKIKVRTVGGCVIYNLGLGPDGPIYFAANESLNMKGVPADKVPQEVKDLLPPP